MKISAPFTITKKWRDIPQQYDIIYTETSTWEKLFDFCEEFPDKRINIEFKTDIDFDILQRINKLHPQVYVKLAYNQLYYYQKLQEEQYKFYCAVPCTNFSFGFFNL